VLVPVDSVSVAIRVEVTTHAWSGSPQEAQSLRQRVFAVNWAAGVLWWWSFKGLMQIVMLNLLLAIVVDAYRVSAPALGAS
jgi:hypothetical protein